MATLASLSIDLVANSASLVKEVKKANKSLGTIEKTAKQVSGVVKLAVGTVITGAFASMARQSIDTADKMGKLAMRLGTTSEAISELGYVAELSGVELNVMTMGLQRMTRRISDATKGTGPAVAALKELGISAEELNKLAPDKQFEVMADALAGLGSQSDRVRLAMKLFDSGGVALVQTMGDGAKGIRAMREEARKMGASISTDAADSAAAFNDEMSRLNNRMDGITRVAAIGFAKAFVDVADALDVAKGNVDDFNADSESLENFLKGIAVVGVSAATAVAVLGEAIAGVAIVLTEWSKGQFDVSEELEIAGEKMDALDEKLVKFIDRLYQDAPSENTVLDPLAGGGRELGGGAGGGGITPEEEEKQQKMFEDITRQVHEKNRILEEGFLSEEQMRIKSFEEQLITADRFHSIEMANIIKHEGNVLKQNKKMEQLDKQTSIKKLKIAKKFGMELLGEAAKTSRAAFNIQKVAAIADGLIKAKESVLGAYAFGNKIGGPPVGAAFAAAAGVVAFGQLKAIKDSQFDGGGGGSAITGGGVSVAPAEVEAETPALDQAEQTQTKTVYFNVEGIGDAELLPKSAVRGLIDLINEEQESNVRVVI